MVVERRELMAKATMQKCIKSLIKSGRIFSHRHGREVQYLMCPSEGLEKNIKKALAAEFKKLQDEIDIMKKASDGFDYDTAQLLYDQLAHSLLEFRRLVKHISRHNRKKVMLRCIEEYTELYYNNITKLAEYDGPSEENYRLCKEAYGSYTKMETINYERFRLEERKGKMASSKRREEISEEIRCLDAETRRLGLSMFEIFDKLKDINMPSDKSDLKYAFRPNTPNASESMPRK